ncbi:SDR family oxidoreductase [Gulosibacter macacae]|uniref:SDR family oxidoreductase n=1 Tax=Gulosibacter macacae TaxID=2488791 RepID=A0A3P3VYK0_9MICO|nr:SDR family oxidoreductase [Gulosibacter macacae]RRJ87564.1 SDR family oxidoreductase [Gulosibacter macacae]
MLLENKVALITGGGSGLGLATAKTFIAEGAKVMILDYNPASEAVADEIGAKFFAGDVSKAESVEAAVKATVEAFGRIDIAVASAGVGGEGDVVTSTVDNWTKTNGIDYDGVFYTNKYAIAQMLEQGEGGSVINLASMFGMVAVSNNIAYSASKGGVVNMTRAAGTMYAKDGVRVNAVAPGVIETPLIPEEALKQYSALHPMGRVGQPQEVADLITFLASDKSKFITGAIIPIDGGYTAV